MTIAAAYLTTEGVVLGADSTTTSVMSQPEAQGQAGVFQLLNHAQKIFQLGVSREANFAICTWGVAGFRTHSHRTVAAQVAAQLAAKGSQTVEAATSELIAIVQPLYSKMLLEFPNVAALQLGYFVGGVDQPTREPKCRMVTFTQAAVKQIELAAGHAQFAGDPTFFNRVYWGFDDVGLQIIKAILKQGANPAPPDFDQKFAAAVEQARQVVRLRGVSDMPIREAIDFIYSMLHITVKAVKFRGGPPICGGPIEVGFVTTDRPFRWARHKGFTSAVEEQQGGDHVE